MANLSQEKRQRMLAFLETIRKEHKDDDEVLIALGEIESELNTKKYGLVWERHEEAVDVQMRDNIPVFTECADKEITTTTGGVNFLLEGDNLHSLRLLEKTHTGCDCRYGYYGETEFIQPTGWYKLRDGCDRCMFHRWCFCLWWYRYSSWCYHWCTSDGCSESWHEYHGY